MPWKDSCLRGRENRHSRARASAPRRSIDADSTNFGIASSRSAWHPRISSTCALPSNWGSSVTRVRWAYWALSRTCQWLHGCHTLSLYNAKWKVPCDTAACLSCYPSLGDRRLGCALSAAAAYGHCRLSHWMARPAQDVADATSLDFTRTSTAGSAETPS